MDVEGGGWGIKGRKKEDRAMETVGEQMAGRKMIDEEQRIGRK